MYRLERAHVVGYAVSGLILRREERSGVGILLPWFLEMIFLIGTATGEEIKKSHKSMCVHDCRDRLWRLLLSALPQQKSY